MRPNCKSNVINDFPDAILSSNDAIIRRFVSLKQ